MLPIAPKFRELTAKAGPKMKQKEALPISSRNFGAIGNIPFPAAQSSVDHHQRLSLAMDLVVHLIAVNQLFGHCKFPVLHLILIVLS